MLTKFTQADRGFISRPVLTPHMQYRLLENHQVLLVSEFFNTLLKGELYCNLLPFLDGSHSLTNIIKAFEGSYSASEINGAIFSLSSKGYLVSSQHDLDQGKAAYWSTLGATPRWAEQQIASTRIAVVGNESQIAKHLKESGANVVTSSADITVVDCHHYLESELHKFNKRFIEQQSAWILVRPYGIEVMAGPVFCFDKDSACWDCLASRLRCHQEVHEFLRNALGEEVAFKPGPNNNDLAEAVARLISVEILKWVVLKNSSAIHNHVLTLNTGKFQTAKHRVIKRPQCLSCGDKALFDPNRKPLPLTLTSNPKSSPKNGGSRMVAPEITLAKYKHLVSPISGVATWLTRTTEEIDPWLHVYWSGSNHGLKIKTLNSLRHSLRSKSAGKGSNRAQSEVSALCEAVERYSGCRLGDEITTTRSFDDFTQEVNAIHPNDVQLFSDYQLNNAESINAEGHPYNKIPQRFDTCRAVDWTPVWSFSQRRHRYLPTSILYGMTQESRSSMDLIADSNGCAAGNTLEEAILQGFYELVERDAFAIWWYNSLQMSSIDLESFDDEFLNQAKQYYKQYDRELWVLNVTSDIAIPTFVAISYRPDGPSEDIIFGAGTHIDPRIAVSRAVCELNQCLTWLPRPGKNDGRPAIDDPMALSWWKNTRLQDCPWLVPAPDHLDTVKTPPWSKLQKFQDLKEEIEYCQALVEEKGMEFLVLDQTRPDIGLNVVRVIVPGMRHFWARLAPGRLYEVPVSVGFRKIPLEESEINRVPVIA